MEIKNFDEEVAKTLDKINHIITVKAVEYRREDNPFHNFERAALRANQTPSRALDGMLAKHEISYQDILTDIENGKIPSLELVEEKLTDILVYFILQKIQIQEHVRNCTRNN